MKTIRIVSPLALVLGILLTAGGAAGYVLLSPSRTWDCPPNYTVDDTGLASVSDGDGGVAKVISAITSPANAWNGAGSARIISAHKGSTANFTLGDGLPMLKFGDPLNACTGNCLAATFTGFFSQREAGSSSWNIDDADIVTNLAFNWTSEGEDPNGSGCSSEVYIEGVMVHEVGHALGLDHTNVAGATMLPSVSYCSNGPATTEADDESAILALYGTAPCTDSTLYPCTAYTEYLADSASDIQPCGGSFTLSGNGTIRGWSQGPANVDFDLYLDRWNGSSWVQVASATTVSPSDSIVYSATAGRYRFRVYSFIGAGTYHFWYQRPIIFLQP